MAPVQAVERTQVGAARQVRKRPELETLMPLKTTD